MSVDYYIACPICKECIHVAQDGLGGWTFYSGEPDCMAELGSWLGEQALRGCKPELMTEDHIDGWDERMWKPKHLRRGTGGVE